MHAAARPRLLPTRTQNVDLSSAHAAELDVRLDQEFAATRVPRDFR